MNILDSCEIPHIFWILCANIWPFEIWRVISVDGYSLAVVSKARNRNTPRLPISGWNSKLLDSLLKSWQSWHAGRKRPKCHAIHYYYFSSNKMYKFVRKMGNANNVSKMRTRKMFIALKLLVPRITMGEPIKTCWITIQHELRITRTYPKSAHLFCHSVAALNTFHVLWAKTWYWQLYFTYCRKNINK